MELKVNLPNPNELDAEEFFAQMRIALKAAEKTYQQAIKGLTEENKENVYLGFGFTEFEATEKGRKILEGIDPDYDLRQSIFLSINQL